MSDSPFFDFLAREMDELRRRLLLCLGVLLLLLAALMGLPTWSHSWAIQILAFLQTQLLPPGLHLVFLDYLEPMVVALKLSLLLACLLSSPLLIWQLLAFTLPAFSVGMRGFYIRFVLLSFLFLSLGVALTCKFMLPLTLQMLLGYGQAEGAQPMITLEHFYSFCIVVVAVFALPFEIPLVMAFLQHFNLVEAKTFRSLRLKAFGVILVVSQLVTPDPILTPSIFCVVSVLLYEMGILMGRWI